MNFVQTARNVARVVVGLSLTLFVFASFFWLPLEARILQIAGVGALLASLVPLSRSRASAALALALALALAGSMMLSGSSYLAVSDVWLAAITGLVALGAAWLPIFLDSIVAGSNAGTDPSNVH